jgi:DivIVA domain-containing protein
MSQSDARRAGGGPGGGGTAGQGLPRVERSVPGYDVDQVDLFLARARAAYALPGGPIGAEGPPGPDDLDGADGPDGVPVTAESIRTVGFDTRRGGYSRSHVDLALDRLEAAFSQREREARVAAVGADRWHSEVRERAQELLDRLDRGPRARFRRVGPLRRGYRVDEVDDLCEALVRYFRDDEDVSPDEVRSAVFRSSRKGYEEAQVDRMLDAIVDVMLSVD